MEQQYLWVLSGLGAITLICQWLSWRIKIPAILLLLAIGILIGPTLHLFSPTDIFGDMLEPIISLAVAVILFEGGLSLNFSEIKGLGATIRNMLTIGLVITLFLTTAVSYYILNIDIYISWLIGSICTITGPTVVVPMLRSIRPNKNISNILRWEGICADPIGAILAIVVLTIIIATKDHTSPLLLALSITETLAVGIIIGISVGFFLGKAMQKQVIPDFLHNVASLCIVLLAYVISTAIKPGTGVLTVTLMGIWIANKHKGIASEILGFKESLSILLVSGLFLLISSEIDLIQTSSILLKAVFLIAFLQFIIRPIAIACSTIGCNLSFKERLFLSWLAPRGIVSASIAALFTNQLYVNNIQNSNLLLNITILIIIGTVVFQGITSIPLARLLGICDPEPNGILIIGSNKVAREIGKALQEHNINILLTSVSWDDHKKARMDGLPTYYGNPVSEHADRHLDLIGLGKTFGLSYLEDLNALAALRYEKEFGARAIYGLHGQSETTTSLKKQQKAAKKYHGQALFDAKLSLDVFEHKLNNGSMIKSTLLSDSFTFEQYLAQNSDSTIPLFAITPKGGLQIFTKHNTPKPDSSWSVISLVPPDNTNH